MNICHLVSNCKLSYHCAKPTFKINIEADLSSCNATESQHYLWNKMVKNRYIITDFPTGDAVATFQLIASYNYLAAHLYILLLYPSLLYALCKESEYIMDQGHFPNCTVLYPGNTPSTVKLYWNDSRQMEFLQSPKNKIILLLLIHEYWTSFKGFHNHGSNLDIVYHNRMFRGGLWGGMGKGKNLLWWVQAMRLVLSCGLRVFNLQKWIVSRISALPVAIQHHQNYINFNYKYSDHWCSEIFGFYY